MIFSQIGSLGGPPIFQFFWILKLQNKCKTNVLSVFKLTGKFVAFHALDIMNGAVPVQSKCICLFHFIGFRGGMVVFMRLNLFTTWASP
jgi:hypothetical protein